MPPTAFGSLTLVNDKQNLAVTFIHFVVRGKLSEMAEEWELGD